MVHANHADAELLRYKLPIALVYALGLWEEDGDSRCLQHCRLLLGWRFQWRSRQRTRMQLLPAPGRGTELGVPMPRRQGPSPGGEKRKTLLGKGLEEKYRKRKRDKRSSGSCTYVYYDMVC
jgi:hypothetical protein